MRSVVPSYYVRLPEGRYDSALSHASLTLDAGPEHEYMIYDHNRISFHQTALVHTDYSEDGTMKESTIPRNQSRWVLGFCPFTGVEVVGVGWNTQLPTPDRPGSQWYCPACGRWHIRQMDERSNGRSGSNGKSY